MEHFIHYLSSKMPLSNEVIDFILSRAKYRAIKKRTIIHEATRVCSHLYFIVNSLSRVFYIKDGVEITAWFGFPGQVVSAIDSFFTGKASDYWIEILEDSEVVCFSAMDIEEMFLKHPDTERLGRLITIENYLLLDERMKLFAFHSAEERYQILIKQFPTVLQRLPLGMIASYIGITQTTLSRIRAVRS